MEEEPYTAEDLHGPLRQLKNFREWPFMGEREARFRVKWVLHPDIEEDFTSVDVKYQHELVADDIPTSPLFASLCDVVNKRKTIPGRPIEKVDHGLNDIELAQVRQRAERTRLKVEKFQSQNASNQSQGPSAQSQGSSDQAQDSPKLSGEALLRGVVYPILELARILQRNSSEAYLEKPRNPRKRGLYPIMRLSPPAVAMIEGESPHAILWAEVTDPLRIEWMRDCLPDLILGDMRNPLDHKLQMSFFGHAMYEEIVSDNSEYVTPEGNENEVPYWFDLAMFCFAVFSSLMCIERAVPEGYRFKNMYDAVVPLCLWGSTHAQLVVATLRNRTQIDIYPLRRWFLSNPDELEEMILIFIGVNDWGTDTFIKWFQGMDT